MKTILIQVEAKIQNDTNCSIECPFINGTDYCIAYRESLQRETHTLHGDYQLLVPIRCNKCVETGKESIEKQVR